MLKFIKHNRNRILLVLLSPLICILFLEFAARLKYTPVSVNNPGIFTYHPNKVYTLKKNFTGMFTDKTITTNSHGYRDDDFPIDKDHNEIRILVLGDSVTFGDGVDANQTFTEVLEYNLNEQFQKNSFQVINTAVPGNGPMQEYYDLMEGIKLNPDLIILQFTLNDLTEPFIVLKRLGGSGWSYHGVNDIHAIDYFLTRNSALYCLSKNLYAKLTYVGESTEGIRKRAKKQEIYKKEKLITHHNHPDIQFAWNEYFSWLIKINNECKNRRIPLILLISPFEFQLSLPKEKDYPQSKLIKYCKTVGIEYIDLIDILRNLLFTNTNLKISEPVLAEFWDIYFHDHDHYTPYGHEYVAHQLLSLVINKLQLK